MKINGKELFLSPEVDLYIAKFTDRITLTNSRIDQLKLDIQKCVEAVDSLMIADIMDDSTTSKKDLANEQARKLNLEVQLQTEITKLGKIKEVMSQGIVEILAVASQQLTTDLSVYTENFEKECCRKLYELRIQQEEIFLSMQVARSEVINKLFEHDSICEVFDLNRFKKHPSRDSFHNNLHMASRSHPQFGAPLITANNLIAVEDNIMRAWANTNAQANIPLPDDQQISIPRPMTLQDVNLESFIDTLEQDKKK